MTLDTPFVSDECTSHVYYMQGASAVKEELLDDILKDSAPYKAPG